MDTQKQKETSTQQAHINLTDDSNLELPSSKDAEAFVKKRRKMLLFVWDHFKENDQVLWRRSHLVIVYGISIHCQQPCPSQKELKIKGLCLIKCVTSNWTVFSIDITTPNLLTLTIVGNYLTDSYIRRAKNLVDVQIDIQYTFADD